MKFDFFNSIAGIASLVVALLIVHRLCLIYDAVNRENFSVSLAFNKKKENLEIPYSSITKFYDPFVKFSIHLEFNSEKKRKVSKRKNTKKKEEKSIKKKTEKIVTLDDFRKKK